MIAPEMIRVDIVDDGQAVNSIHCRAFMPEARSEVPRSQLSNDLAKRAAQLQDIDLQLRMGILKLMYAEVWQAGIDLTRKLSEIQAQLTLTPEQDAELKKALAIGRWLARVGLNAPPANGQEPPRIVRAR